MRRLIPGRWPRCACGHLRLWHRVDPDARTSNYPIDWCRHPGCSCSFYEDTGKPSREINPTWEQSAHIVAA